MKENFRFITSIITFMMLTHFNLAVKASPKTKEESSKAVKKTDKKQAEESEVVKETAEPPAKKIFLITQKKAPGKTFYDIGIAVNGKRVRVLYDKEIPLNIEITEHFRKGENKVSFFSVKRPKNGKIVKGKKEFDFKVLLLLAQVKEKSLEIEEQLIEYTRNASETKRFVDEFVVELE